MTHAHAAELLTIHACRQKVRLLGVEAMRSDELLHDTAPVPAASRWAISVDRTG
jgi:hypothetical protein